jgi:hypothetical protein
MKTSTTDNPFVSLGGAGYSTNNGVTVYSANNSASNAIQTRSQAVRQAEAEFQASDSCGGTSGCGRNGSYVLLDIDRLSIPQSTGVFNLDTGMGWMNSVQKFYARPKFTAPRSLCCTNDFPIHERPELCCDTTTIKTFYMAWRSCLHEHNFICAANGYQEWNPEEAQLQQTAIESMAHFANMIAFNGLPEEGLIGLANNPKIMQAFCPSFSSAPAKLIIDAITHMMGMLRMWESIQLTADGNYAVKPYLFLIPSMYYDVLNARMYEGKRLIDWIEGGGCCETAIDSGRPTYRLRFVPIPELNSPPAGMRPMGYIMRPGDLDWMRPYFTLDGQPDANGGPFSMLPPQRDGLFDTTIAWFRCGSVIPKALDRLIRVLF